VLSFFSPASFLSHREKTRARKWPVSCRKSDTARVDQLVDGALHMGGRNYFRTHG
jgi:hypothetical protein